MKKRFLSCLLAISMVLTGLSFASVQAASDEVIITQVEPQVNPDRWSATGDELLTLQEDPDEIVEIIVELEKQPASGLLPQPAAQTAATWQAVTDAQAVLKTEQASVQSRLNRQLGAGQLDYGYSYTLLLNGFSVKTARKNLAAIQQTPGVAKAFVASYYQLPEAQAVESGMQAAFAAVSGEYTGAGTVIAIVDTGLDLTHQAFSVAPENPSFTREYIRGVLQGANLNAETMLPGLGADDVFVSSKIPFAFDYGMGDANVSPENKTQAVALSHGTHVAGIAAGYAVDEEGQVLFSGIAPDAQVIPMKVFDDGGTGASSGAVLAALEDAYLLGVDAVNLSLGTRSGYTVDEDDTINEVYNRLDAAGIMVITAAGNDTSSSAYNTYGENLPLTADPDNSIVSSPSTYPSNLSVASVDGQNTYIRYFLLGEEEIKFSDSQTTFLGLPDFVKLNIDSGYLEGPIEQPYDYVMVPGYGDYDDYANVDVTGKIAVVQRGGTTAWGSELTFANKLAYAVNNDAIGVIVYNNDAENPDDYNVVMATNNYQIPACFVSYNMGQKLAELEGTGVGITLTTDFLLEDNATAGQISSFSSIGVTPDLRLKPEISAIGGNVYSAVPNLTQEGGYAVMSGTSMASPYVAGASILVEQRLQADWFISNPVQATEMTENLLMATAQLVYDPDTNLPYSPRFQGSGQLNLAAAMDNNVYLFTEADAYGSTKPVANLGDDVEKRGEYTVSFSAQNLGGENVAYDIEVIAMSPDVEEREGYRLMSDRDVLLDYITAGQTSVSLIPGGSASIDVTITLTEDQRAKLDSQFENGIFVEGYVRLIPTHSDTAPALSVPFVAFYGDWSQPGMFDYATMLNDQEVSYSNYATVIGAWFSFLSVKLGANLSTNEYVPIREEHLIISPNGDTLMDGVEIASLGLLRDTAEVRYSVTNEAGEVLWTDETQKVPKTSFYTSQGGMVPATHFLDYAVEPWYGVDSEGNPLPDGQYYYTIQADPVTEHESANVRDTVTFPVYIDTNAPYLKTGAVSLKINDAGRMILGLPVADDHILLEANVYPTNANGSPNLYAPIFQANYGLAGMEDIQSTLAEVDVTDYAGTQIYLEMNDWGYNSGAYLIQIPETVSPDTLTLSSDNLFLFTGNSDRLFGYNSLNEEVLDLTWTTSDEDVVSVDGDGGLFAVAPGVATITATTASGVSASCVVGVEDTIEFTSIRLDYDEFTVKVPFDSAINLPNVYVEPYDFSVSPLDVTWTLFDETLARQVSNVTLWTNETEGTLTVTAEYQGMTASFDVEIYNNTGSMDMYRTWITPSVNLIFTQGNETIVGIGRDAIYPYDKEATSDDQIITFTYDNHEAISLDKTTASATANREGCNDHTFITALYPGTATITATATDTTQDTVSWMVTVLAKRYDGIHTLQSSLSLCVGGEAQMADYVEPYGENVLPEFNPVYYTSLAPDIVSVAEDGTLTAHKAGTGLIRAMLNTGDYALVAVHVSDHVAEVTGAKDATCTEEGYTGDTYCAVCGAAIAQGEVIPALGHKTELVNAKPATCTEDGYTGDQVCTVCGVTVVVGEVIPANCPSQAFTDLDIGLWYHEYTDYVIANGLMNGVGDNLFAPNNRTTRAQLVTVLYRLAGSPAVTEEATFTDVAGDIWYSAAIAWAEDVGIAQGVTETRFAPGNTVTREQAATFLYRFVTGYLAVEPVDGADLSVYADAGNISGYAEEAVAWATAEGLFEGFPDGRLLPQGTLTRVQMAKLLTVLDQKF